MNQVSIDIDDYLSEDDKRAIARKSFAEACDMRSEVTFQRLLNNAGYSLVQEAVDASFDEGMHSAIKSRAIKCIEELGSFMVFRRPDAWDAKAGKGWEILQSAVESSRCLIQDRVNEIIAGLSYEDLREIVDRQVGDAIMNKLKADD